MGEQETTIVRCPSCGAPITMGETRGTCSYCETVVERQLDKPHSEPVVLWRPATLPRKQATPRKRAARSGCGCVVAIILATVLFVGFMIVSTTMSARQIRSVVGLGYSGWPPFREERITDLVQVVPRDAASDDMLVLLDGGQTTLGLIDSTGHTLRWQTPPLSKDAHQSEVVLGPDTVYLVDQTRLLALRLKDGALIWQALLPVDLASGCGDCLKLLGDRLVVLEKDRTLQAFDAQTGRPAWDMRLAEAPRRIPVIDHKLAVVQPVEGQSGAQIQLIDPADGSVARRISPSCTRGDSGSDTADFYTSSLVLPSADGASLLAFFDESDGCAQRWDPSSAAPTWQTWLKGDIAPSSWDVQHVLLTDRRAFIANEGVLAALDTTSGALTMLAQDKEYNLTPLFARGDIVVVKATPDWDRNRHSLWGLDATTGERRWQYAVQAKEWFGDSGFNEWGAQLTPQGVTVVQVPEDAHQLIVERLDLQTGTSVGRQVTTLDGSGSTTVWENRWSDRRAWLLVDSTMYTIDLVSGEVVSQSR